jgi:amidase
MQQIGTDVLYFHCGPDNAPTHRIEPGETVTVRTQMNRGPWIDPLPAPEQAQWLARLTGGNPSSGCLYVAGAEPGDMLTVTIGPISLDEVGYTQYKGDTGAMPGWMGPSGIGAQQKVVRIADGVIHWSDELQLPARPMIGFVGVAPALERFHNGWGGYWGGNFDVQEITTGAQVHLRVNVPGALVHIGDMHAIQGDGEICGAGGIETGGTVQITCQVTSPAPSALVMPRIETPTHLAAVGMARPAEDAFRTALVELIRWLGEDYDLEPGEAYMLLGQVMEARVTQFVNPTFTYVAKIAKEYVEKGQRR